jgi:hypothetical protein
MICAVLLFIVFVMVMFMLLKKVIASSEGEKSNAGKLCFGYNAESVLPGRLDFAQESSKECSWTFLARN